jgi:mRNA-degrading endonuclease RelE of RelBE toxin-antitoxin system
VIFTGKAKIQFEQLNEKLIRQVNGALDRISHNPFSGKPLRKELKGIWSERVSTFRILYKIYPQKIEILILVIEHRKKVYGGH